MIRDIKNDLRSAKKFRLHWPGIVGVMFGGLLICLLFDHFGRFDLAPPTANAIGILSFTVFLKRDLSRHFWFWITMAILAAGHVVLILSVSWITKWVPAGTIAGIDIIDLIVMLMVIDAVGELAGRWRPSSETIRPPNSYEALEPSGLTVSC
ncbi:MAG: hypothetical protein ACM3TN_10450 [Alphaproteobacteria bacterium]